MLEIHTPSGCSRTRASAISSSRNATTRSQLAIDAGHIIRAERQTAARVTTPGRSRIPREVSRASVAGRMRSPPRVGSGGPHGMRLRYTPRVVSCWLRTPRGNPGEHQPGAERVGARGIQTGHTHSQAPVIVSWNFTITLHCQTSLRFGTSLGSTKIVPGR
jgi:hypothetical protein